MRTESLWRELFQLPATLGDYCVQETVLQTIVAALPEYDSLLNDAATTADVRQQYPAGDSKTKGPVAGAFA